MHSLNDFILAETLPFSAFKDKTAYLLPVKDFMAKHNEKDNKFQILDSSKLHNKKLLLYGPAHYGYITLIKF